MITVMAHRLLLDMESSSPVPISWSRTRSGGTGFNTNEANFDTNMVIILAALLCALICALGLNSVVRCALRCRRRFALETPDETAARLAARGLKKNILKEIPVVVYGAAAAASSGFHIVATDCAICLGEFADGENVRVLPGCYHGFHVRCIDTWLVSHPSCPTCRQSLLEQPPPPSSSDIVPEADAAGLGNGNSSIGPSDGFLVAVEEVG